MSFTTLVFFFATVLILSIVATTSAKTEPPYPFVALPHDHSFPQRVFQITINCEQNPTHCSPQYHYTITKLPTCFSAKNPKKEITYNHELIWYPSISTDDPIDGLDKEDEYSIYPLTTHSGPLGPTQNVLIRSPFVSPTEPITAKSLRGVMTLTMSDLCATQDYSIIKTDFKVGPLVIMNDVVLTSLPPAIPAVPVKDTKISSPLYNSTITYSFSPKLDIIRYDFFFDQLNYKLFDHKITPTFDLIFHGHSQFLPHQKDIYSSMVCVWGDEGSTLPGPVVLDGVWDRYHNEQFYSLRFNTPETTQTVLNRHSSLPTILSCTYTHTYSTETQKHVQTVQELPIRPDWNDFSIRFNDVDFKSVIISFNTNEISPTRPSPGPYDPNLFVLNRVNFPPSFAVPNKTIDSLSISTRFVRLANSFVNRVWGFTQIEAESEAEQFLYHSVTSFTLGIVTNDVVNDFDVNFMQVNNFKLLISGIEVNQIIANYHNDHNDTVSALDEPQNAPVPSLPPIYFSVFCNHVHVAIGRFIHTETRSFTPVTVDPIDSDSTIYSAVFTVPEVVYQASAARTASVCPNSDISITIGYDIVTRFSAGNMNNTQIKLQQGHNVVDLDQNNQEKINIIIQPTKMEENNHSDLPNSPSGDTLNHHLYMTNIISATPKVTYKDVFGKATTVNRLKSQQFSPYDRFTTTNGSEASPILPPRGLNQTNDFMLTQLHRSAQKSIGHEQDKELTTTLIDLSVLDFKFSKKDSQMPADKLNNSEDITCFDLTAPNDEGTKQAYFSKETNKFNLNLFGYGYSFKMIKDERVVDDSLTCTFIYKNSQYNNKAIVHFSHPTQLTFDLPADIKSPLEVNYVFTFKCPGLYIEDHTDGLNVIFTNNDGNSVSEKTERIESLGLSFTARGFPSRIQYPSLKSTNVSGFKTAMIVCLVLAIVVIIGLVIKAFFSSPLKREKVESINVNNGDGYYNIDGGDHVQVA